MNDKPVAEMSFEEAIRELEAVVSRLEGGEVPLEDSIALYQRGSELRAKCDALLKAAEEKVAKITTDADGNAAGTAPLDVD
ncbi:exodeoxyribonuclease VII small subunit [Vannielia litorea]|uniref:exodeoxyribonuclease VII small subunit n=1 Tax=Vannielia TaxID=2813041 RepID=UPI001C98D419|nr:exodeoxyribonuclease VII small subunit [Vannielia litorea]MBY6049462.1 exodeoxyribonuclease VII small subunit [Vannielia litorea]MBY6076876.1 exodeoxyribonuclease VII small subunit [Vannielia litorea]MBY6155098.1 exodeoxyribonuclease VII small subunit [Vannielia litorea]